MDKQPHQNHTKPPMKDVSHDMNGNLTETFGGKKPMENDNKLSYLGVQLSSDGRNMETILQKRNKQIGNRKRFENLHLGLNNYTFECGFIYLLSLVRSSILYGTQAMFNMTETEIRELEKIEEGFMRQLYKPSTGIQVPIHLMYLDSGLVPSQYIIQRYKVNYLQYILQQGESSILYRMLYAQLDNPVKGDWASEVSNILIDLDINLSFQQIKLMEKDVFQKITKQKMEARAFFCLIRKQKSSSKGKHLNYGTKLQMGDYLCPNNKLSLEDQREIFRIRCEINQLPANKGQQELCVTGCGETLDNTHILQCVILSDRKYDINSLINGNLEEMAKMLKIWKENTRKLDETRDSMLHC